MALEQKGIVSELSQLSRMVQTLNARLVQPNQASPVNDLDEMRPAASRQVMSANG